MTLDLGIHTYGYGELLLFVLNGIAKFRMSGAFDTLVVFVTVLTGFYYAINISCSFSGDGWKVWVRKLFGVILFVQLLMIPTTSMKVEDHVVWKVPKTVDNIPLAFALPVGMVESWGYNLTKFFEQSFNWVGSKRVNNYSEYGTVFGVQIAQEFSRMSFQNPEIMTSAVGEYGFVKRCILDRGSLNHPFTLEEVRDSDDVWKLVRDRTIKNRSGTTKWEKWQGGNRTLHNCMEGVKWMDKLLDGEVKSITTMLLKKFGYSNSRKSNFLKDIAAVFDKGGAIDAANIIKHHLIMAGIEKRLETFAGAENARVRAQMQYEATSWTSWLSSGILNQMLPVFKIVVYVSFIIILPLLLMSGGHIRWRNWVIASFALSLWPPLYTILNMIIDYSYDVSQVISFGKLSTIQNQYDMIGVVAAALSTTIPFIATWVIRLGEGGFLQMSTAIMQSVSSGASTVGAEISSGNISLNNRNIGNESYNNISSDKLNTNFEQFSGEQTFTHGSGMIERHTASGNKLLSTGEGMNYSKFANNINMRENIADSLQTALSDEQTYHDGKSVALQTGLNTQKSQLDEYISKLSKQVLAGEDINWSELGNQGKAVAEAVHHEIQNQEGITKEQRLAATASIRAFLGVQASKTILKTLGLNAGVEASVMGERSKAKINTTSQNTSDIESQGFTKNYDAIEQAATNERFNESWGSDKDLVQNISATETSNMGLQNDITKSKARIDSLRNSREQVNSFSSEFNANATHKVADKLKDNYGMSAYQVQLLIDDPTSATANDQAKLNSAIGAVRDDYVNAISNVPKADIQKEFGKTSIQGNTGMENLNNVGVNTIAKKFGENQKAVKKGAADDGFIKSVIEREIANTMLEVMVKKADATKEYQQNIQKAETKNNEYFENANNKITKK